MSIDKEGEWKEWFDKPTSAIKTLNGDPLSAIQLKCLQCCCGSQQTIRTCKNFECPLWSFRPYKDNLTERPVSKDIPTREDFYNKKDKVPEFQPPRIEKKRRRRRTKLEMQAVRAAKAKD